MSSEQQKRKSEEYAQLGGMDPKTTSYDSTPLKFLNLENFDFFTPGALSQRWGSTMYFGQTYPGPAHSIHEFARLDGSSYVVSSYSGGIFYGATTGQNQGMSFTHQGVSVLQYGYVPMIAGQTGIAAGFAAENDVFNLAPLRRGGARYFGITTNPLYGTGETTLANSFGAMFLNVNPTSVQSDNRLSFVAMNNFLYAADGSKFFKFDGVTTYAVGLPPPCWLGTSTVSVVLDVSGYTGLGFQSGPSFGTYYLFSSYVNNRGFEGPAWPLMSIVADTIIGTSASLDGGVGAFTGISSVLNVTLTLGTPLEYGISAINIYSYYDTYNPTIGQTIVTQMFKSSTFPDNVANRFWNMGPPVLLKSYPASGSTTTTMALGTTIGAFQYVKSNNVGSLQDSTVASYSPIGLTAVISASLPSTIKSVDMISFFPQFLESFQNRLFLAGFSLAPSVVWFSDVAEPEGYRPNFNFEVRTNDGDVITAMRAYQSRLYLFKEKSFHVLIGDNEQNFDLNQITDQYGAVNNRSVVVYQDILLFLDRKGVMIWNGAGINCLSTPMQPIFDRMNYAAAKTEACAVHDKLKNQVIFSIPIDGSSTNNIMCVYDYNIGQWTSYTGANASAMNAIIGRNGTKNVFFGDYSGRVNWMGASFLTDNGVGFTTLLKTRFFYEMGQSVQKMYRRLYLNANNDPGSTLVFTVKMFKDYSASFSTSATMVLGSFQSRIDFGISARSIAFEIATIQTNLPLKIHGFTVESRYLRKV